MGYLWGILPPESCHHGNFLIFFTVSLAQVSPYLIGKKPQPYLTMLKTEKEKA